jgi:hypothetical protein
MWYDAELVVKSYKPLQLEVGMLFIQKLHQGTLKEETELFALERVPQDEEAFVQQNGYPVELYVIGENDEILASDDEIAFWDEGEEELFEMTIDNVNKIFNEYDGIVQIDMVDVNEPDDEYEHYVPIVYEGNVVLRYPQDEYEEWEEDWEEEEDEEVFLCGMCNGTGQSINGTPDVGICSFCKGTGIENIK